MNLPNKLSLFRLCLVPLIMVVLVLPESVISYFWSSIIGAVIFVIASLTDCLDGQIARRRNLITDFGKFIDPLADKFMVLGALLAIVYRSDALRPFLFWAAVIVIFRELAVTSIRLLVSRKSTVDMAAHLSGKIKTVAQIVCIVAALIEPLFYPAETWMAVYPPVTLLTAAVMVITTIYSGISYIIFYGKYLDPEK
ncbi:MAG: CDP-diacylglycerol--glycerol-3-phosphate 3-phosphatidyltransferase [Clostridia bacterium]|nr:CDP-diacylglycerol--glycerol-3-phosphate 3-phosphatidyltransferase [Clostridia bacterium]